MLLFLRTDLVPKSLDFHLVLNLSNLNSTTVWTSSATTRTSAPSALWVAILRGGTFTTGALLMGRESRFCRDCETSLTLIICPPVQHGSKESRSNHAGRQQGILHQPGAPSNSVKLSSHIWSVAVGWSGIRSRRSALYGSHNCRHGLDPLIMCFLHVWCCGIIMSSFMLMFFSAQVGEANDLLPDIAAKAAKLKVPGGVLYKALVEWWAMGISTCEEYPWTLGNSFGHRLGQVMRPPQTFLQSFHLHQRTGLRSWFRLVS